MKLVSPRQYLDALSVLSKIIEVRKFMLVKDDFYSLEMGELEIEIDNNFKFENGFGIRESEETDQILRYEKYLDSQFSKVTNQDLIKYSIVDEIEILKTAIVKPINHIERYSIKIHGSLKEYFMKLKFTAPNVSSIVRTGNEVYCFTDSKDFFIKSNTVYKGSKYDVFCHLVQFYDEPSSLYIRSFFLTDPEKTGQFNAARLFLNILDWYGLTLRINGKVKKFFLKETIFNQRIDGGVNFYEIVDDFGKVKTEIYITNSLKSGGFYYEVSFVYGINETKYLRDLGF